MEDGTKLVFTLPDPAKILHMAGMAEYLDGTLRDYESIRVLSDNSHVEYLHGLLRIAQRCPLAYENANYTHLAATYFCSIDQHLAGPPRTTARADSEELSNISTS